MREEIELLSKDKRAFVDAGRKTGDWAGVIDLLAHQNSDKTHFIFELLQNADDTHATSVTFSLYDDRLEFSHNGIRLFDYSDIESIVSIGRSTKKSNYTKIGKHGIGFKAVFAYTHRPKIFSGDISFEIEDGIVPVLLDTSKISSATKHKTCFVLPFDNENIVPTAHRFRELIPGCQAKSEIEQRLKDLSLRTLLFLSNIESIQWNIDGNLLGEIHKSCERIKDSNANKVRLFSSISSESWIVFSREVSIEADIADKDDEGNFPNGTLKVAFLESDGKIIRADNTELVVYFPTAVKTDLGFLIHGPFKTTKARDNIKGLESDHRHTDLANNQIIDELAKLTSDSLETLCKLGLMNIQSYLALPIRETDFEDTSFFRPIYNRVREAFLTRSLLPVEGGGFIMASKAKLARVKDLPALFTPEQLGALFGVDKLFWLDSLITETGVFKDLYDYLTGLTGSPVTPESLEPKLTTEFMRKQSSPWIINFIIYTESGAKALRKTPFIRLQSGEHVALADNRKEPPAWFAPAEHEGLDLSAFPLVHADLAANETVREFLLKEGIREIDIADLVIQSILPKYIGDNEFTYSDYLHDLQQIVRAYSGNDETKQKLEEHLDSIKWLACVQAGNDSDNEIVWKEPSEHDLFARPDELDISSSELDSSKIYFLHPLFDNELKEQSSFKDYLSKCVKILDNTAIVEQIILPKYRTEDRKFNESDYRKDLQWILKAPQATDLTEIPWLACIHASGNKPSEIFWRKSNENLYESTPDNQTWFSRLEAVPAYFLHDSVLDVLGARTTVFVRYRPLFSYTPKSNYTFWLDYQYGYVKPYDFDINAEIVGLLEALGNFDIKKFDVLWNILVIQPKLLRGEIKNSKHITKVESADKRIYYTKIGDLCREKSCIPDKHGNWYRACELYLLDLPDEFETKSVYAKDVAEKLGMKKPELEKAVEEYSKGNPRKIAFFHRIANATEDELDELEKFEKLKPQIAPPQPAPSFKNGLEQLTRPQRGEIIPHEITKPSDPINNPERYQNKVDREAEDNLHKHETTTQTVRFQVVLETPSNADARVFLYQQYQGKCQISGSTFPKASANADGYADNYFESCALLSYRSAGYLNDAGNMLCVSADTMAKLKHASFEWIDDLPSIISNFSSRQPGEVQTVEAKIRLCGEECAIRWSERHFTKLVALYKPKPG